MIPLIRFSAQKNIFPLKDLLQQKNLIIAPTNSTKDTLDIKYNYLKEKVSSVAIKLLDV